MAAGAVQLGGLLITSPGATPCAWKGWVARPTDFIDFLQATNTEGMWIVNPNATAHEASAAVAYFNGAVGDTRPIGVDIRGDAAFDAHADGRRPPLAVTEFNMVSVQDQDNEQLMTRAVNALFLADSVGQAIQHGYAMLNQWDLANGRSDNGTEYGLMHEDNDFYRAPQYYVYPLWARFGAEMLPLTTTLSAATQVSVYAGRVNSSTLSVLAINKGAMPVTATIEATGALCFVGGTAYVVQAASAAVTLSPSSTRCTQR